MQLKLKCRSCRQDFDIKHKALSRPDLEDKIGEYFREPCTSCGVSNEYHVNDVKAYDKVGSNLIGTLIGIAVIVFVTVLFWDRGYVTNVGFLLGGAIIAASNFSSFTSNSSSFNKYMTTRTKKD